jgi:hypothetical protein
MKPIPFQQLWDLLEFTDGLILRRSDTKGPKVYCPLCERYFEEQMAYTNHINTGAHSFNVLGFPKKFASPNAVAEHFEHYYCPRCAVACQDHAPGSCSGQEAVFRLMQSSDTARRALEDVPLSFTAQKLMAGMEEVFAPAFSKPVHTTAARKAAKVKPNFASDGLWVFQFNCNGAHDRNQNKKNYVRNQVMASSFKLICLQETKHA